IVSVVTLVWGISPRQPSGKNIIRWLLKKRTNGSVRYCQYTSEMSTFEIEQQLLEQFLRNTWKKMDEEHKQEFLHAFDARVNELEELLPLLMKDKLLAKGVSHLLSSQLTRILRTHAAMSVLGHGLLRGAGLGGPVGAALNGVKAVSGSAYRVTIPAVLQIACLRRMVSATQV
ncbi:ubiquinol-cytochrome C chaperone family protein, partial [Shigella flexneri]|uniref:ubiquinol-cytochrome C chaperone family protein n=2 Tax=Shigella flexneri TaxID=623 RepID=UPI0025465310